MSETGVLWGTWRPNNLRNMSENQFGLLMVPSITACEVGYLVCNTLCKMSQATFTCSNMFWDAASAPWNKAATSGQVHRTEWPQPGNLCSLDRFQDGQVPCDSHRPVCSESRGRSGAGCHAEITFCCPASALWMTSLWLIISWTSICASHILLLHPGSIWIPLNFWHQPLIHEPSCSSAVSHAP